MSKININEFPFAKYSGQLSLLKCQIQCVIPVELNSTIQCILKALQIINVLRMLHIPATNKLIDEEAELLLKEKINILLTEAALAVKDESLKNFLMAKTQSFLDQDYSFRSSYSPNLSLPFELLIGMLPSWRYKGKPKTYSGLLALTDFSNEISINNVDEMAIEFIEEICGSLQIKKIFPSTILPKQITCDIVALAGDFAAHPLHIAHFLPEDEGFYDTPTYKTLIYRNLYVTRYKNISVALVQNFINSTDLEHLEHDKDIWKVLSSWFRGHDIGHNYFDMYCKILPGIDRKKRYTLQEAMADLFGLQLALKTIKDTTDGISKNQILSTYIIEMFRYLSRDITLFPDSRSAWFQFGYLFNEGVIETTDGYLLKLHISMVEEKLNNLLVGLLEKIINGEAAYIERLLEKYSNFNKKNEIAFRLYDFRKEIDPEFSLPEALIMDINEPQLKSELRSISKFEEFDTRQRF